MKQRALLTALCPAYSFSLWISLKRSFLSKERLLTQLLLRPLLMLFSTLLSTFALQESLDELQEMVVSMFSGVENKNVEIKEWKEHPYGKEQVGIRGHIVPVKVCVCVRMRTGRFSLCVYRSVFLGLSVGVRQYWCRSVTVFLYSSVCLCVFNEYYS